MRKRWKFAWFILYVFFGLYFINSAFFFVEVPNFVEGLDKWISLVGGLLIIFGSFKFFRVKRRSKSLLQ